MKVLKEIFARIWALWGIVSFIVTFLIIFIPSMITYLLPDPKGTAIFIKIAKIWMTVWLHLVGCPLKIRGTENFAKNTAIIPTVIFNTRKALPGDKFFYFLPNKLKIHFLEPIPAGTLTSEQLKEKVFNRMKDYYVQHLNQ